MEIIVTAGEEALSPMLELPPSPLPAQRAIPWKELTTYALSGASDHAEESALLLAATQLYQETGQVPERTAILARIHQNMLARDGESAAKAWNRTKWPMIAAICERYGLAQGQAQS
jgi:hypothetical protein